MVGHLLRGTGDHPAPRRVSPILLRSQVHAGAPPSSSSPPGPDAPGQRSRKSWHLRLSSARAWGGGGVDRRPRPPATSLEAAAVEGRLQPQSPTDFLCETGIGEIRQSRSRDDSLTQITRWKQSPDLQDDVIRMTTEIPRYFLCYLLTMPRITCCNNSLS